MSSDRVAALRTRPASERAEAIEQLGALLSAVQAELVDVITAADLEGDCYPDGATCAEAWVMGLLGVGHRTAKEWVRVGAALQERPALRELFASGTLSWDQVAPATEIGSPDDDATVAERAAGLSARQLQVLARRHRTRTRADDRLAQIGTQFAWREDRRADGFRYSGFLPTELAARLNACLEREAERLGPDAETGTWAPLRQRAAHALVALADQTVADDLDPQGAMVVVHADAEVIDGRTDGNGLIGDLPVAPDSVLRLLCDAKVEFSLDGPDGTTIGIARTSHAVPRWLRRHIAQRDGCCRFPGCGRPIRHRHHIRWWSRGGPTNADNLVGLCWAHHHLVHEGGWTIDGNPGVELTFRSPAGRELRSRPNPLRGDVRRRVLPHTVGPPPAA